jgi:multidrug resistance efflux pump
LELGELERKGQVDLKQFQSMQSLYKADSVSQQELDLSKRTMESSKIALEQFTQNYSNSLNDRIEALSAAEFEFLNTVAKMMPNMGVGNQINWQTSKDQLVKNLELLGKKIESLQLAVDQCRLEAETEGIYNLAMDFAIGDLVAEGTKIGTIVPESSEVYLAEMALGNQDVGRVKVGDKVKFKLDALPYREYGFVMGDIISISPDAVIDSKSGQSYYKAVATFKNQPMKSYKGVNKFVKVGMSYEAHVVAERKKILWVLMEKLQLSL